jgi:Predicted membrane protein
VRRGACWGASGNSHGLVNCGSVRDCSGDEATTGDLSWAKWSYWLLHSLLFLSVYTAILVLPHTRWRVSNMQY